MACILSGLSSPCQHENFYCRHGAELVVGSTHNNTCSFAEFVAFHLLQVDLDYRWGCWAVCGDVSPHECRILTPPARLALCYSSLPLDPITLPYPYSASSILLITFNLLKTTLLDSTSECPSIQRVSQHVTELPNNLEQLFQQLKILEKKSISGGKILIGYNVSHVLLGIPIPIGAGEQRDRN